jgi:ectoine hydroxylase-related dioxygenase (phytanoyl-CoA dioxygenase family)
MSEAKTMIMTTMSDEQQAFFRAQGYVVLRSFLSAGDLEVLEKRCKVYAPDPSLIRQYAQEDDSKRFEYSLSQELPPEVLAKRKLQTSEGGSESESESGRGPFQLPVLTAVASTLCAQLHPAETFCIVSEPGARAQVPHSDSIPMEGQSDEHWQAALHYIGALVPLQATNERCGQTGIVPTSHVNPHAMKEIKLSMDLGDVLVMDGRTTHRGLANTTDTAGTGTVHTTEQSKESDGDGDGEDDGVPPRRICFFTFTLPDVTDGNALAYAEKNNTSTCEGGECSSRSSSSARSNDNNERGEQREASAAKKVKI